MWSVTHAFKSLEIVSSRVTDHFSKQKNLAYIEIVFYLEVNQFALAQKKKVNFLVWHHKTVTILKVKTGKNLNAKKKNISNEFAVFQTHLCQEHHHQICIAQ